MAVAVAFAEEEAAAEEIWEAGTKKDPIEVWDPRTVGCS